MGGVEAEGHRVQHLLCPLVLVLVRLLVVVSGPLPHPLDRALHARVSLVLGVDSVVLVLLVVEVRDRHWRTAGNLHFLLLLLVLLLLLHLLNRCRGRDLMHSLLFSFLRSRRHHLPPGSHRCPLLPPLLPLRLLLLCLAPARLRGQRTPHTRRVFLLVLLLSFFLLVLILLLPSSLDLEPRLRQHQWRDPPSLTSSSGARVILEVSKACLAVEHQFCLLHVNRVSVPPPLLHLLFRVRGLKARRGKEHPLAVAQHGP
mmetsp:Transcript_46613/g.109636  ORF Transcript_46613/g.109636 Transcript_46613/m.109636 type:complete len:257 (+) Transcript_46613:1250-2020(+)